MTHSSNRMRARQKPEMRPAIRADLSLPDGFQHAELTHLIPATGPVEMIHAWPADRSVARLWLSDSATLADLEQLRAALEGRGVVVAFVASFAPQWIDA